MRVTARIEPETVATGCVLLAVSDACMNGGQLPDTVAGPKPAVKRLGLSGYAAGVVVRRAHEVVDAPKAL